MRLMLDGHAQVTPREHQVLGLLLDGLSVREVADALESSVATGRMHIRNLHKKTRTRNLHSLVLWAVRHLDCCGLHFPGESGRAIDVFRNRAVGNPRNTSDLT